MCTGPLELKGRRTLCGTPLSIVNMCNSHARVFDPSAGMLLDTAAPGWSRAMKPGSILYDQLAYNLVCRRVLMRQVVFEHRQQQGVLVGFWCPAFVG